jgi:hypothetical protein
MRHDNEMKLIREAVCQSCAPEHFGLLFDGKTGMRMLRELLADCLLFRMGSVPVLPRRVLTVQCSPDIVNEYFRLWRDNPVPDLFADTLLSNPHLICEDTLALFSGVRKYRGSELLENAGFVFPRDKDFSGLYDDLALLYAGYRLSRIFRNREQDSEDRECRNAWEALLAGLREISAFWQLPPPDSAEKQLKEARLPKLMTMILDNSPADS